MGHTIGLLDDNPIILSGLESYCKSILGFEIIFKATNPIEFLENLNQQQPHILIMDVIMKEVDGPELFKTVREMNQDTIIIAFSDIRSINLIKGLYGIGVNAFVSKKETPETLFSVIEEVLIADRPLYIPIDLKHLIGLREIPIFLTEREKTIANHIKNGLTNKEISTQEFISVNTVAFHKKQLFKKFNARNVAELVREIIDQGYAI